MCQNFLPVWLTSLGKEDTFQIVLWLTTAPSRRTAPPILRPGEPVTSQHPPARTGPHKRRASERLATGPGLAQGGSPGLAAVPHGTLPRRSGPDIFRGQVTSLLWIIWFWAAWIPDLSARMNWLQMYTPPAPPPHPPSAPTEGIHLPRFKRTSGILEHASQKWLLFI